MGGEVMKIVVIGGTGLIGSKVVEKLKTFIVNSCGCF
jgi:nucleoside-diphosphate-sugar epimerase